jgi:RNA polymerase sigma-70 factor, ECF subfamily
VDQLALHPFWPRFTVDARPAGLNQLTDLELIAFINEGNESAFAALYHRHRDWVVNLAYRWTGDRDLALDVLQETFFYFSRKFPGFRLTAKLQTFFYPVVRNLSIAARRKLERFQSSDPDDLAKHAAAPAPTANDRDQLHAVLASLSEEHREVLLLRFVDGLSLSEISSAMEIPLGTVKSRLHNSLETLRKDPLTKTFFQE